MATHSSTLAWEPHEWRSLVGRCPWGHTGSDATEGLSSSRSTWISPSSNQEPIASQRNTHKFWMILIFRMFPFSFARNLPLWNFLSYDFTGQLHGLDPSTSGQCIISMKTINSQWSLLFSSWNIPKSPSMNALVCFVEKYPLLPSHLLNIKLLEPVDPGGSSSSEFHKVRYAFSEESLLLLRSSSCTILSSFLAPLYLTFLPSILVHQVLSHFPYLCSFTIIVTLSSFLDYFFHSPLKKFKFFHHLEK